MSNHYQALWKILGIVFFICLFTAILSYFFIPFDVYQAVFLVSFLCLSVCFSVNEMILAISAFILIIGSGTAVFLLLEKFKKVRWMTLKFFVVFLSLMLSFTSVGIYKVWWEGKVKDIFVSPDHHYKVEVLFKGMDVGFFNSRQPGVVRLVGPKGEVLEQKRFRDYHKLWTGFLPEWKENRVVLPNVFDWQYLPSEK